MKLNTTKQQKFMMAQHEQALCYQMVTILELYFFYLLFCVDFRHYFHMVIFETITTKKGSMQRSKS